jgi:hypothetical protein
MAEEIRNRGGLGRDALGDAEQERDYPSAADNGRVIRAETRLVVVDASLREQLEQHNPVEFQALLKGSVQIWAAKLRSLRLEPLPGRRKIYAWPYDYDAEMLGYMAGVLKIRQFLEEGVAIL